MVKVERYLEIGWWCNSKASRTEGLGMRLVVTELSVGFKASPYPGLLTPVFVTCSTKAGEGLVKLITCNDVPVCVEEQQIPFVQL